MIIVLLFFIFFISSSYTVYGSQITDYKSPTVSAIVGQNMVTIFGYTSPLSKVELTSVSVLAYTQSQQDGYYEFSQAVLPKNPSDLCIRSIDDYNLSTKPVCIPPPPDQNYHTNIGPVILPPTLALNSDSPQPYQNLSLSGQSIPNSTVTLSFYQKDDSPSLLPKAAFALNLPQLTVPTDEHGNWNTNLPTSYSTSYRFYAAVLYQDNHSPLSNSLLYNLPSLWYLFWLKYSFYIISFTLFFLTLGLLIFLLIKNRQPKRHLPALWHYFHSCLIIN